MKDLHRDSLGKDTWTVFKIMGEFVEGFETLSHVEPAVSIFGSARFASDHEYTRMAREIARRLSDEGFSIITGGGPGIMEAANRGAKVGKSQSIGLNIKLPFEQRGNGYTDLEIDFDYFFARKVMFVKYAVAYVVMPGGYGTMDEMFEALTLKQTGKIQGFPVILFGKDYWSGLIDWMKNTMLKEKAISPGDMDLFHITDDIDEICDIIKNCYQERCFQEGREKVVRNI